MNRHQASAMGRTNPEQAERESDALPTVTMYLTQWCPYCVMANRLLAKKGVEDITRIDVDSEPGLREEMMARSGRRTVPQIFIGSVHVGGYDDLSALDRAGKLDALLAGNRG